MFLFFTGLGYLSYHWAFNISLSFSILSNVRSQPLLLFWPSLNLFDFRLFLLKCTIFLRHIIWFTGMLPFLCLFLFLTHARRLSKVTCASPPVGEFKGKGIERRSFVCYNNADVNTKFSIWFRALFQEPYQIMSGILLE